jgi:hypothetical protein
LVCQLTSKFT